MALQRLTDERIIRALYETGGVIDQARRLLKCAKSTIYERINESEEVRAALEEARDELDRAAEQTLLDAIHGKGRFAQDTATRVRAAMFIKNNSPASKANGWGQRTELTGAYGGAIELNIDEPERVERVAALLDAARTRRDGQIVDGEDMEAVEGDG